jgi:hypothetical protein
VLVLALYLQDVEEVDAGGSIADEHLSVARFGDGRLGEDHPFGFAELVDLPGFHSRNAFGWSPWNRLAWKPSRGGSLLRGEDRRERLPLQEQAG